MAREFSVLIERDAEGFYVASVPALRGCHTQATSLDELMARVREAVELCLEVQGEDVEPLDLHRRAKDHRRVTRLPRVSGREVVTAFRKSGFEVARIKGSHHFLPHRDGRGTVVPVHGSETIGPGLLAAILRDPEIDRSR